MRSRTALEDRALLFGVFVSLLWHFFWFFSITITVGPTAWDRRTKTRFVALGPVLDDTIFRTLVESRPQISKAFYRQLSDFEPPEPSASEIPAIERYVQGNVVSVPFGKKFGATLKDFVDGDKPSPDSWDGAFTTVEDLEEEIRKRALRSKILSEGKAR